MFRQRVTTSNHLAFRFEWFIRSFILASQLLSLASQSDIERRWNNLKNILSTEINNVKHKSLFFPCLASLVVSLLELFERGTIETDEDLRGGTMTADLCFEFRREEFNLISEIMIVKIFSFIWRMDLRSNKIFSYSWNRKERTEIGWNRSVRVGLEFCCRSL